MDQPYGRRTREANVVLGGCCVGLLWTFNFLGGGFEPYIFGFENSGGTLTYRVVSQLCAALVLFACSFVKRPFLAVSLSRQVFLSCAGCFVSVGLLALQSFIADLDVGLASAMIMGVSYAVLLRLWAYVYADCFSRLFQSGLVATMIALVTCLVVAYVDPLFGTFVSVASCVGSAFFILYGYDNVSKELQAKGKRQAKAPFLRSVGIVLCNLASGTLQVSLMEGSYAWVSFTLLATLFLLILAELRQARGNLLFLVLALSVSVCSCGILVAPFAASLFSGLAYAGFWLLFVYAVCWFADLGEKEDRNIRSRVFARGMASVLMATQFSKVLATYLPYGTALTICVALTALSFVLFLIKPVKEEAVVGDGGFIPAMADRVEPEKKASSFSSVAGKKGLTAKEYEVAEYLVRGYSLKKISSVMSVSENTAKFHRRNVYRKLDVSSRQDLIDLVEGLEANGG